MDLVAASAGLVSLAPVLLATAAAVRLDSPGPALFRQPRLGLNGRVFEVFKFRTMKRGSSVVIGSDHTVANPADDPRVTRFGALLRKTSMDELPQLLNILKGDMSLVGPRPDLPEGLDIYNARQQRKLEVRPGITGLAQTSGRNALSAEEKWELDVRYVETAGLVLDLKLLLKTVATVLSRDGVWKER